MHEELPKITKSLLPFSYLFGAVVGLRNRLFDWGVLRSESFNVPIICVGNLTVGGTGKTPHTEYLVSILYKKFNVAVLSRGYKRKTRGFLLADDSSGVREIGDEPFQIKNKFPHITVAVDEKRRRGIQRLLELNPLIDVIILDDAFQHRYVKPGLSILLMDYTRKIYEDQLLPAGRLREPLSSKERANIMIVTKCPTETKPIDIRIVSKYLTLRPHQQLYFSSIQYGEVYSVFNKLAPGRTLSALDKENEAVLLVTGIASTRKLKQDLSQFTASLEEINFPDHHNFVQKDIEHIEKVFSQLSAKKKIILVTEKDAVRLQQLPFVSHLLKENLYYLPIQVDFLDNKAAEFNQKIYDYVKNNKRNR